MGCGASAERETTYTMYHGTSMSAARSVQANGFIGSTEGELGPGVYFVDKDNIDKAKRFAHDEFHRAQGTDRATDDNQPALIECEVTVKRFISVKGVDREGRWFQNGYDAAFTEKTDISASTEWCIGDPSRIKVISVLDLRNTECPWGRYCPYLGGNNKVSGAPWGGRCPMMPEGATCKRAGCSRQTWNGQPGEYCGKSCKNADT